MKKKSIVNPQTQKARINVTLWLLVVILSCLVFILLLFPSKTDARVESGNEQSSNVQSESHSKSDSPQDQNKTVAPVKKGKIAVIIDDAGYNLEKLKRLLEFPGKLTIAVLPQVAYSTQSAELVHRAGKEVILHLPMQPEGDENPGPGLITVDLNEEEIEAMIALNLTTVPHAKGLNNHMGSLATADEKVVRTIVNFCKQHNLFFLDSKTTVHSLVAKIAGAENLPVLARDIFLDNERNKEYIKKSLFKGMELAKEYGKVVLIGHIGDEMTDVLNEMYPLLIKQGYELVTASELLND
jgi:polysaccharide deacetylase 2 family uncharacterized protein YibQ